MRKRKINPQYLRQITAQEVKDEVIDALDFSMSLVRFADEYLGGIMNISVSGVSRGTVKLNLPVTSYLIRLLAECGDSDELIEPHISLDDTLSISVTYTCACPTEDVATIVKVARLAGFEVKRDGNSLYFTAKVTTTHLMQLYATSADDFLDMLITTYKM